MTSEHADDLRKLVYPETYFVGLSPQEMRLALLSRGIHIELGDSFRYLELGFGSGFSLNIHAAANDGEFWGNDFVREHVDGAASIAAVSGARARFLPDAFADLLKRDDLPAFDMIAAHGIWTWVPDDDRAAIVELLKRKLAPGGVFYVSYNNTAGWSQAVYLRQMMKLFLAEGGGRAGVGEAIAFARSLQRAGAAYFKENPIAGAELAMMAGRDPVYLQQEYFLDDWKLMSLADVEHALRPAGLEFGAQFPLIAHADDLVLGAGGREIIANIESPLLRETVREAFQGMGFRQDIFVKQPKRLAEDERREHFGRQAFLLTTQPRNVMLKGGSPWGDLDLGAQGCAPIINAMDELGAKPHSLAALKAALPSIAMDDLIYRMLLLAATGVVRATLATERQQAARARCAALNAHLLGLQSGERAVLASPVLGAGVEVSPLEKAFMSEYLAGRHTVDEIAPYVENTCGAELRGRSAQEVAGILVRDHLPVFRAMGLIAD
ncbi:MAG: methyltransferase regulatory domain-containing protein [Hyphomonadaceae bacterium]